jgi:hypothetical protein
MKRIIHRLAGVGFGAALAIILSVDVEAAPLNTSQGPSEISASDGLVMQATSRVRVRRGWRAIVRLDKRSVATEHQSTTPTRVSFEKVGQIFRSEHVPAL